MFLNRAEENFVGNPVALCGGDRCHSHHNHNARASAAGRSLLGRPCPIVADSSFTASAASTPAPGHHRVVTEPILRSCLSSSRGNLSSLAGTTTTASSTMDGNNGKNEEFVHPPPMKRNVSFSHLRVREYDVTLGDNPSVSSGFPLSLDWRYDPRESVIPLSLSGDFDGESKGGDEAAQSSSSDHRPTRRDDRAPPRGGGRSTSSGLKLSDSQRYRLILSNPSVSMEDLSAALESTFAARLERRETLNEVLAEEAEKRGSRATTSLYETKVADKRRTGRMVRRSGIVDGGLMISITLASI